MERGDRGGEAGSVLLSADDDGRRAAEAQDDVCTGHFRATEIRRVPFGRSIGID